MKKKINLSAFFGELIRNNNFLKILAVFLAIFAWIYILYNVNPVNEVVFEKVEVDLSFEGSVPDRNGYMYLMEDPNLTVRVTVSGSRTELLNLSKEDIKATLNMDSVISAGTYNIGVSVNTGNSKLTVAEVYPKNFTIEFAKEEQRVLPVELQASGSLPNGYSIENREISPKEITVTGPSEIVEQISKAYFTVSLTNMKENFTGTYNISLVNEAGENIDRRYLTLSDASVEASFAVAYHKTMTTDVKVTNPSGSYDVGSYITVTLDTDSITATGAEKKLSSLEKYTLGTINTSEITKSGTVVFEVPPIDGVTFSKQQVTATVEISKDTATKTLSFNTDTFTFLNVPEKKTAQIQSGKLSIRIRSKSDTIRSLTTDNLKCVVDLSSPNQDGSYPVIVKSAEGIPYDVIGSYSVNVTLSDAR